MPSQQHAHFDSDNEADATDPEINDASEAQQQPDNGACLRDMRMNPQTSLWSMFRATLKFTCLPERPSYYAGT
jgi:hypothetical protein